MSSLATKVVPLVPLVPLEKKMGKPRPPGCWGWCPDCGELTQHTLEGDVPACLRCAGSEPDLPLWDLARTVTEGTEV